MGNLFRRFRNEDYSLALSLSVLHLIHSDTLPLCVLGIFVLKKGYREKHLQAAADLSGDASFHKRGT